MTMLGLVQTRQYSTLSKRLSVTVAIGMPDNSQGVPAAILVSAGTLRLMTCYLTSEAFDLGKRTPRYHLAEDGLEGGKHGPVRLAYDEPLRMS